MHRLKDTERIDMEPGGSSCVLNPNNTYSLHALRKPYKFQYLVSVFRDAPWGLFVLRTFSTRSTAEAGAMSNRFSCSVAESLPAWKAA